MSTAVKRLIVGVGNAGVTILDALSLQEPGLAGLVAVNSDAESLSATVVRDKIEVPAGDPAQGFAVVDRDLEKLLGGVSAVVLCGGLGGETASFLLPAIAILAKSAGITVAACVGTPFSFEGRRRGELAAQALEKLHAVCDAVAVIGNDRLSGGAAPSASAVGEAFALADGTMLACTRALHSMLGTSGPVKITRADLKSVLGRPGVPTLFGVGSASGANRLHEALESALSSPLLIQSGKSSSGSALVGVPLVLLMLQGPEDLSFAEVQSAVVEIERLSGDRCQVRPGVAASLPKGSPLTLFITASAGGEQPASKGAAGIKTASAEPITVSVPVDEPLPAVQPEAVSERPPLLPKQRVPRQNPPVKQTQGTLELDTYQRGRFDKSEPTIVAGEDLDIPTYLRKGIKLAQPRRS